ASFAVSGGAEAAAAGAQPELAGRLHSAASTLRTSMVGLRSLVVDIYPATLRTAGLPSVLRDLAVLPADRGPRVSVRLDELAAAELDQQQQQAMFRLAQECLRNTVKHAQASEASIELYRDESGVCLQVSDNGIGFDLSVRPQLHLGLSLIEDVAASVGGRLECHTAPGHGTSWRLWVRSQ
ncbi:MAG: ATP-binding protein, partial [Jatrophihabitantaceae bacterium]